MRGESEVTQILKQELEALETNSSFFLDKTAKEKRTFAITALRAALAEYAMQRLADVQQEMESTIKDNLTVEPVAWLQIGVGPLHEGTVIALTAKPKTWNPEWWRFEPLYTAPPRRKPLTDNQISSVWKTLCSDDFIVFARAIERAHGIGGEE